MKYRKSEEARDDMTIMPYASDSALDNVVEMTRYARELGTDYQSRLLSRFRDDR